MSLDTLILAAKILTGAYLVLWIAAVIVLLRWGLAVLDGAIGRNSAVSRSREWFSGPRVRIRVATHSPANDRLLESQRERQL